MKILTIQFSSKVYTNFGEQVYICGNVPQLGSWEPAKGLKLYTQASMYPNWSSFRFIHIRQSTILEFKLCIVNYSGIVVRWQNLPSNGNRKIVVGMNMSIIFQQGIQEMQIKRIDPIPRISVRKKTLEILNDLDSDSSQSKQFWKEFMEDDEDGPTYYRNFVASMKRIIQSQGQDQSQIRNADDVTNPYSSIFSDSIQYEPQNYMMTFDQQFCVKEKIDKYTQQQNGSRILLLKTQDMSQTISKIRYLANAIISEKQYILVAHLYLKGAKLEYLQSLLKSPLQWKIVLHLDQQHLKDCLKLIQLGINMLVTEDQQSLKNVFSLINSSGYRLRMVKPLLYVLQMKNYKQTFIHCTNCLHERFLQQLRDLQQGKFPQNITKINKLLFMNPHFPSQFAILKTLHQQSIFKQIKYGKRILIFIVPNVKQISQKITKILINLAELKNHEIYFIQSQKLTGVQKSLPITKKDRLMVINSNGDIYASGEKVSTVPETLSISPRRIRQMYEAIIKNVGADSHCKIKITRNNTMLIEFTADQIGQCVKKYILNSISEMNIKSLIKLMAVQKDDQNIIEVKPICCSWDFYIRCIISGAFKVESFHKNLLLCIDYSSEQKTLYAVQKIAKKLTNVFYQGFFCDKKDSHSTNSCRQMITQQNLANLLQKILEESINTSWMRSPQQTTHQSDSDDKF